MFENLQSKNKKEEKRDPENAVLAKVRMFEKKSEKFNEIENGYRDEKIVLRSRELDSNISNHRKAISKSASCEKNIATRLVMGSDDKLEKFKEYTPGKHKLRTFCTQFPKSYAQNPKGTQKRQKTGPNYQHSESKNSSDKLNG